LGGGLPEFLDLHYKELPYCDHVAKFHGDRARELGGSPANKKKHLQQNIRPSGTNVPGGLIRNIIDSVRSLLCRMAAQMLDKILNEVNHQRLT